MKCKKCGADIPRGNVQFCPYCGADFSQSIPLPASEVAMQKSSKSTKKDKTDKKPFYKDLLFWMVIILILPFIFWGWLGLLITPVLLFGLIYVLPLFIRAFEWFKKKITKKHIVFEQANKLEENVQKEQVGTPEEKDHSKHNTDFILDSREENQPKTDIWIQKNDYDLYIRKLIGIGFSENNAEEVFEFDQNIVREYALQYFDQKQKNLFLIEGFKRSLFLPFTEEDLEAEAFAEKVHALRNLCVKIDETEKCFWVNCEFDISCDEQKRILAWRKDFWCRLCFPLF